MDTKTLPVEFFVRQDLALAADRLLPIAWSGLWVDHDRPRTSKPTSTSLFLCNISLRHALGAQRSAPKVPSVYPVCSASGSGGTSVQNLSGLERNGNDVHEWPHPAACARRANQLVQHAALALPRSLVAVPVCEFGAGLRMLDSLTFDRPLDPLVGNRWRR